MGFTNVPASVALATGTSVALAAGSSVGLAAGSSVAVNGTAQVAGNVVTTPDQSRFWPCYSAGDTSAPPTLGSGSSYGSSAGQPALFGGGTFPAATWNALARYAGSDTTRPCVVTGVFSNSLSNTAGLGFNNGGNTALSGLYCTATGVGLRVNGATVSALAAGSTAWRSFELVFTATLTRLTVDNDAVNLRWSGAGVSPAPGPFCLSNSLMISNLFVSYPSAVPA